MTRRRFALVAGGGTGGHLVPALAVARALAEVHGEDAVELVGSRRGLDPQLLLDAGLPVTLLPGRGLVRRWDARSSVANAAALAALAWALALAVALVVRRRPAVVLAMGGYACVPVALAAALTGVPVVLVNLDAVPGAAGRLVGRFARASAVAFAGTPLPRAVVTGAPLRPGIVAAARPDDAARAAARRALGLPGDRFVIGAVGGSLGARTVNAAVGALVDAWSDRGDLAVYHVVGRRDAAAMVAPVLRSGGLVYRQVAYEQRMPLFYEAADVVVCRAGANTVAELGAVGVPAILVPLPGAPDDHQRANAAVLERAGGAVVLADSECTGPRLAREIDALRSEPGRLRRMGEAAASIGRPDALSAVVRLVEAHSRASFVGAGARGSSAVERVRGGRHR